MNGLAPTASPIALTLSSGATSSMAMEIDVFIAATSTLPASDTTCSIRHFKHVSCGCTSSSGEVGPVSGWKLSVAKVFSDFSTCSLPSTSFKNSIQINAECNQVITESPNVKLTSSSVPTAAKKHSCQPDSAHLFSHTGWCASFFISLLLSMS